MLHPRVYTSPSTGLVAPTNKLEADLYSCNHDDSSNIVAYVSKMFAVPRSELPDSKTKEITAEEMRKRGKEARERRAAAEAEGAEDGMTELPLVDGLPAAAVPGDHLLALTNEPKRGEALIGFARIYSGVIKKGSKLLCVSPKYNTTLPPDHPANTRHISSVEVSNLYMMMGRELVPVELVPAGNIFAVAGLEGKVLRNATLCAPGAGESVDDVMKEGVKDCLVNLAGVVMQASHDVVEGAQTKVLLTRCNNRPHLLFVLLLSPRILVSSFAASQERASDMPPPLPADLPKLVEGLRLLNQADPCVEVLVQETGEHVILTAGELHLERCLKDLRERFAKCAISASEAIVPFRETAVKAAGESKIEEVVCFSEPRLTMHALRRHEPK